MAKTYDQKNYFDYSGVQNKNETVGKILSYIYRKKGQIFYEHDLVTYSSMHFIIEAFNNTLKDGEFVNAYFLSGEKACGVRIVGGNVSSMPMNDYYRTYHDYLPDEFKEDDYDDEEFSNGRLKKRK